MSESKKVWVAEEDYGSYIGIYESLEVAIKRIKNHDYYGDMIDRIKYLDGERARLEWTGIQDRTKGVMINPEEVQTEDVT